MSVVVIVVSWARLVCHSPRLSLWVSCGASCLHCRARAVCTRLHTRHCTRSSTTQFPHSLVITVPLSSSAAAAASGQLRLVLDRDYVSIPTNSANSMDLINKVQSKRFPHPYFKGSILSRWLYFIMPASYALKSYLLGLSKGIISPSEA